MPFTIEIAELPVRLCTERPLTDDELLAFCSRNEPLRVEREATGELSIMSPTGSESGGSELRIAMQLMLWADTDGRGNAFGPSAGFRLPNGAVRAADAAWVRWARWKALTKSQQQRYAPLCPDFVIELRSPSDQLAELQAKMREWIASGAELGWLVDPERTSVEVYRPGQEPPDLLEHVTAVHGEGLVAGFVLELSRIW